MATQILFAPHAPIRPNADVLAPSQTREPQSLLAAYLRSLSQVAGIPFVAIETGSSNVLAKSHPDALVVRPESSIADLSNVTRPCVMEFESGLMFCAVKVPSFTKVSAVAVGWLLSKPNARPSEVVIAAAEQDWPQDRLDAYLAAQPYCSRQLLELALQTAVVRLEQESREGQHREEVIQLTDQLETTYEEIALLHNLARNLHVSYSPAEIADLCLDGIQGRIGCDGNAMWLREAEKPFVFLSRGELPMDQERLMSLPSFFEDSDWSRPCVINQVPASRLGNNFPELRNLVLVPIGSAPKFDGWILSWNLHHCQEYGTVEASLLSSIATILGTHLQNIELFRQNADLLLSFVRSLVSTLDAKDPYTRGHSERVALIARRLGNEMHLSDDELKDIYLAGLLHDIGKIGVDDSILRKPGSLTNEEFTEIQKHPMIGYSILKGLKNLKSILPGVRNHHESYNGTGYPDRLEGENIPLIARILAVADSYDAMGSDRPYRKGMPVEKIEEIFRNGAGRQWDKRVIDAYFTVSSDVSRLCTDYSPMENPFLLPETADA